ncbi:MAG: aminoacyl-histidine dipeptidase [Eubacteriales bacterium]|nr:aminoacyl-histidine dipeptidase [Eubacteriales bacterium]
MKKKNYLLEDVEPKRLLHYFEEIAAIPHGSGNVQEISDYLVAFAKEHGLRFVQDKFLNVVIYKDASAGYEDAPVLILQGHMDMVCEKRSDVALDMEKEAITLRRDGDYLSAEGTTLGADDGVAVAAMLAILEDDSLAHPALECLITTDEEIGLIGAQKLDTSVLQGRRLLNMDSEEEGIMTAGCAGGAHVNCLLPLSYKHKHGTPIRIEVSGLRGGHSGEMIGSGRASANQLMGRLLQNLRGLGVLRLIALDGGTKDNAITRECAAEVLLPPDAAHKPVEAAIREFEKTLQTEYQFTDPGVTISYVWEETRKCRVIGRKSTDRVIRLLCTLPYGVQEYNPAFAGLPQTSLNLGSLHMTDETLRAEFLVRSSLDSQKEMMEKRLAAIMEEFGGEAQIESDYPAWQYAKTSAFRDQCVATYRKVANQEPKVVMIHGGLECGIFSGKMEGLDAVSIGPDTEEIHTPNERVSLSSLERTWQYLVALLADLKQ